KRFTGEWIDEVASRAAAQNEQYMELMQTPGFRPAASLGYKFGWNGDAAQLREKLLTDPAFQTNVASDRAELADALKKRNEMEHCGQADAAPACKVTVRLLYQVLRGFPPEQVCAQTLLGFEVASADSDVAGINFVMPE